MDLHHCSFILNIVVPAHLLYPSCCAQHDLCLFSRMISSQLRCAAENWSAVLKRSITHLSFLSNHLSIGFTDPFQIFRSIDLYGIFISDHHLDPKSVFQRTELLEMLRPFEKSLWKICKCLKKIVAIRVDSMMFKVNGTHFGVPEKRYGGPRKIDCEPFPVQDRLDRIRVSDLFVPNYFIYQSGHGNSIIRQQWLYDFFNHDRIKERLISLYVDRNVLCSKSNVTSGLSDSVGS